MNSDVYSAGSGRNRDAGRIRQQKNLQLVPRARARGRCRGLPRNGGRAARLRHRIYAEYGENLARKLDWSRALCCNQISVSYSRRIPVELPPLVTGPQMFGVVTSVIAIVQQPSLRQTDGRSGNGGHRHTGGEELFGFLGGLPVSSRFPRRSSRKNQQRAVLGPQRFQLAVRNDPQTAGCRYGCERRRHGVYAKQTRSRLPGRIVQ